MRFRKLLIGLVIVFWGALILYLPLSAPQGVFNTPDENANYFFATHFSFYDGLRIFEPIAQEIDNTLHPRGVNVINSFLVPESFLGLPFLYGTLFAAHAKDLAIFVFAGVLTWFGLYALYNLFLHFFGRCFAQLSLLLVLTGPAFLYWSGRPFMHTILFFDLLVLSWWLLLRGEAKWNIISGILLGSALMMRTSEVVWVGVGTLLLLVNRKVMVRGNGSGYEPWFLGFFKLAFGLALVIVPLLFVNQDLYGNFFGTGYSVSETSLVVQGAQVPQLAHTSLIAQLFLPFGFHPLEAFNRFVKYALGGMWWYVIPMILGAIIMFAKKETSNKKQVWYVIGWFVLSAYLALVYGSFRAEVFADPAHPLDFTIGAPYLRYWLPIFVFGAPMITRFFLWIKHVLPTKFYILHSTFYILLVFLSLRATVWHGPESWRGVQENLWTFAEFRDRIERISPENAVFIVPRWADRIYFPTRKVIVDVEGKDMVGIIKTLRDKGVPLFWHRGRGEVKLEPELSTAGFKIERRFDLDPKGKLYEIRN